VLPSEVENWQAEKTRVVLSHELAHIKRRDFLTQYIARAICSIFWFMPFIWVAYSSLHLEQEKACDSTVVYTGAKPANYASHMLELAYFQGRRILLAGLFLSKGRKIMLEKRILNVLSVTGSNLFNKGGTKMKISRLAISFVSVLAVIIMIGSSGTAKQAISEEDFSEAWGGTWVNTDYKGGGFYPKIVLYADGTKELYVTAAKLGHKDNIIIIERWIDKEGIIWYKTQVECEIMGAGIYEMGKISDSGNTLELIASGVPSPIEEWEPDRYEYAYRIYYRE
jgi:hypothetical protein